MSRVSVQKNPKVEGAVAHDAVDADKPVKIGGIAGAQSAVATNDRVNLSLSPAGLPVTMTTTVIGDTAIAHLSQDIGGSSRLVGVGLAAWSGSGSDWHRLHDSGASGPGLGALKVAPIGGDITLRSSAIAGEAGGTSTAVDNLGWVKGFNCHLDITAAPSGGAPTLDVYLQTQLASGDWQDIVHFAQASGVTAEIVDYGPPDGNFSGIGAEGSAMTYDRFFAEQDGAMSASNIRQMNLGDSMRVKWAFAAGGSTGDFTFAVTGTFHS
jgi:hypothetical protein